MQVNAPYGDKKRKTIWKTVAHSFSFFHRFLKSSTLALRPLHSKRFAKKWLTTELVVYHMYTPNLLFFLSLKDLLWKKLSEHEAMMNRSWCFWTRKERNRLWVHPIVSRKQQQGFLVWSWTWSFRPCFRMSVGQSELLLDHWDKTGLFYCVY